MKRICFHKYQKISDRFYTDENLDNVIFKDNRYYKEITYECKKCHKIKKDIVVCIPNKK